MIGRSRGVLGKQSIGADHKHLCDCVSLRSPQPVALSANIRYFHLLWELPVRLPVDLGFFFFFFFKDVILYFAFLFAQ